ncbi:MAG: hypothetical protein F4176_10950, partial [Acidimicrobiia bacterium]|nr:hypothetical protein [Acidimicrobiia bacterium]
MTVAGMTQHYRVFPGAISHDTLLKRVTTPAGLRHHSGARDDTFLERVTARVTEGDTLRADVTSHRSADTNTFTPNP